MRAAMFTLIGLITMSAVLTLPRDADDFSTLLAVAGCRAPALSYPGLAAFPASPSIRASRSAAGLWRGVFSHKNIAGPVMAALLCRLLSLSTRLEVVGVFIFRGA